MAERSDRERRKQAFSFYFIRSLSMDAQNQRYGILTDNWHANEGKP